MHPEISFFHLQAILMKRTFFLLTLTGLVACQKQDTVADTKVLMSSDIDSLVGWVAGPNTFSKGKAHSGKYSLGVDQSHEFSPNYAAMLGDVFSTRPRGVKLSAWVYATDEHSGGKLEFVLKDGTNGQEQFRKQFRLTEVGGYGKWVRLEQEINFPKEVTYSSQIFMYVSRAESTTPAYVDDLQLTALTN